MILYAIIAAFAVAAIGGAYWTGHDGGKKDQLAVDEPVIQTARAERQTAILANNGLQRDLTAIQGNVAACNQQVGALKADTEIRIATLAKIQADRVKEQKDFGVAMNRFEAGARPAKPVAPDLQCEAARAVLVDLSENMKVLDALGLGPASTAPLAPQPKLSITPPKVPPKSAIKTLGGGK